MFVGAFKFAADYLVDWDELKPLHFRSFANQITVSLYAFKILQSLAHSSKAAMSYWFYVVHDYLLCPLAGAFKLCCLRLCSGLQFLQEFASLARLARSFHDQFLVILESLEP